MSNILSYNKKTTGEGWIQLNDQYNADEIEMISDPDGGMLQTPRTAIPSPFAQMELVKNAFQRLSVHADLNGEAMDKKLVSDALDIAQLLFNYKEYNDLFHIIEWNKQTQIDRLKTDGQHKLLGETIEMFLRQDAEAFNFNRLEKLYFVVYGNSVIGGTSPVTLFMATPNAGNDSYDIFVEENRRIFTEHRPLHERKPIFVKYVYAMFTAYPELKRFCHEVNNYIIRDFSLLDNSLRNEIIREIGNPEALDVENEEKAKVFLTSNYDIMEEGVQALDIPFFCARAVDIQKEIAKSDFVIAPSFDIDETQPLVLQNNLNATKSNKFRYVTRDWDDTIVIKPEDYALSPDKRTLPATRHRYPWLTDDDFLQPVIMKLDYTSNHECFFDGNISTGTVETDKFDFILPLKPLYFKYFKVSDLWGTVNGHKRFELRHKKDGSSESVEAILRVPVSNGSKYIKLSRVYIKSSTGDLSYDVQNNYGHFITVPFALSIFPFIKSPLLKQYNVQLIDRALGQLEQHNISLSFYKDNYNNILSEESVTSRKRSLKAEKRVGTSYYKVTDSFDYIKVGINADDAGNNIEGIICPKWAQNINGHDSYTFAVDLGTTNTHIEYMRESNMPEPLNIDSLGHERLIATLYNSENILYDAIMRQEFLPKCIDETYGFPQRTVLSESEHLDARNADDIVALGDTNIPFIYEKESVGYGNRIVPDIKWSADIASGKRIRAYITELALLMRTKVILENGDLRKTRLVWFYPLSMKIGKIRKMEEIWSKTFQDVFGVKADNTNIIKMPESVAPYYYYKCSDKFHGAASCVASIDIGGGTSDIAVFEPNSKQPIMLSSFRFAANVLFGDGFSEIPHGDTNPMVVEYARYFKELFNYDDDKYGELHGILDDILEKRKSEDVNAFFFSIVQNKIIKNKDIFSYNHRLGEDYIRKIIFIYFYAAIIYYVAKTMHHRRLNKPRSVMFSGTGSKILDIIGNNEALNLITQTIFEMTYNEKYDSDGFSVIIEKDEPKQITCRGALMQVRDKMGCESVYELNRLMSDLDTPMRYNHSMISKEFLTYNDMNSDDIRNEIIKSVKEFNDFFISLCDNIHVNENFLVANKTMQAFRELMNKNIEHHLANGWIFMNKNIDDKNDDDIIEDTVFFYPIIGIIRNNLIENLYDKESISEIHEEGNK